MPAKQKKKNIIKPLFKKDGVVVPEKELPPVEEYIEEEDRLRMLDEILNSNRERIQTEQLDEEVDWDVLKKKKRKPNKKHTRKGHILQIAPGISLMRRQILTILFQLELDNARLKSIPTPRIARSCKSIIRTSPKFNHPIRETDPKYQGNIDNMNEMKMSKAALEKITIYVEKRLENIFRWAWVLNLTQKKTTLMGENFQTAQELLDGKYDISNPVNFNTVKQRYGNLSQDEVDLEKRVEEAGLHSIDQIYSILENADLTLSSSDLFIPDRLARALKDNEVKTKLADKGTEFVARLRQQVVTRSGRTTTTSHK